MKRSTSNIHQRTASLSRVSCVDFNRRWMLNVECWMFVLFLLLAGCARFHPQPILPEQTMVQLDARRFDDAGLQKFLEQNLGRDLPVWPPDKWDLNTLTLAAFYFHPDLDVARAQWRLAEAGVKTAAARPNPTVTAAPSYDSGIPGNFSPWLVPVTVDLPVETAGKRAKRIAEALDVFRSARWSLITAAWQIRSGVRAGLVNFNVAEQRLGLLDGQLAAQELVVKLLQQRFDVGEIARPELVTAQIALSKTRLDTADAQTQLANTRSHLAEALGVGIHALEGANLFFDFSAAAPEELTSADARRIALLGRSDIRGALADYAAVEDELRLQIAKQYPDLHLSPGYAWNNGNAGDSEWSLGLTLEVPILDQNQGPIAEAKARRELAAAQFTALQAKVIGEIDRAVAAYHVANDQLKTSDALLAAEQKQQQSVAAQFKFGAADSLDAISAQMELDNATLVHLDGQAKFQAALGDLEDALQRPANAIEAAVTATALTNIVQTPRQTPEPKENRP